MPQIPQAVQQEKVPRKLDEDTVFFITRGLMTPGVPRDHRGIIAPSGFFPREHICQLLEESSDILSKEMCYTLRTSCQVRYNDIFRQCKE